MAGAGPFKERFMNRRIRGAALTMTIGALCATTAFAQAAGPARGAGGPPPMGPLAVPNPTYTTMVFEIEIDRPAEEVWKRVGKYCDIGEWFQMPCTILSGKDGEVGAVRSIGNEILVGKTELSYTYTQPVIQGRVYDLYHGTMEARPLSADRSKIVYTLVWDNSMLPDDAARERERNMRRQMFERALANMKILAEGGTLPPPAPRGAGPGGAPGGAGAPGPRQ
jgi:uncharacterized protein YndB with AHSA1/START domain